jgi:hypothetical protein
VADVMAGIVDEARAGLERLAEENGASPSPTDTGVTP